jgi:pimeloyl-ACP methyl ester carboxylesterase
VRHSLRTANGRELVYDTLGDGPPLVCHPGGPGMSASYFEDLGGLDRERTIVQLHPRGTAGSDAPSDAAAYTLEEFADDVDAVRLDLGLGRIDLLGHSAGGFVSMVYASTLPQRVGRLVLVGTFARFSDEFRRTFAAALAENETDPRVADAVAARRAREQGRIEGDPAEQFARELPVHFASYGESEAAFIGRVGRSPRFFHLPALRYFNTQVAPTFDLRPRLARIAAPTLIVSGERDPSGGAAAGQELAELIPDARQVVLEGIGHFPWIEAPERFRSEVSAFLRA